MVKISGDNAHIRNRIREPKRKGEGVRRRRRCKPLSSASSFIYFDCSSTWVERGFNLFHQLTKGLSECYDTLQRGIQELWKLSHNTQKQHVAQVQHTHTPPTSEKPGKPTESLALDAKSSVSPTSQLLSAVKLQ